MTEPVLTTVRAATDELHRSLETTIEVDRLLKGSVDRARYTRLLTTHLDAHRQIAGGLAQTPDLNNLLSDWSQNDSIAALIHDLGSLGADATVAHAPSVQFDGVPHLLGWIYVVEGACHGNCQLLAKMRRDTQFVSWDAHRFLGSSGQNLRTRWPRVMHMLSDTDPADAAHVTQGAIDCFTRFSNVWRHTASAPTQLV